ncbi:ArsR family transcriptional regulator [Streptomyces sp. NPDC090306]|uniref:ArsR family transcriptional regulator n=1 Tax=unclassified Streptomyces TaxID=2593676 RepID=UPI0036EEE691
MLRIHFSAEDLTRVRVAVAPHPLWEIACSLHRFQTADGRWAYAHWHRTACANIRDAQAGAMVRKFLLPLFPRASYFPDFLTPAEGITGLEEGLNAVLETPPGQVAREARKLATTIESPAWVTRIAERDMRDRIVGALRSYHRTVIAPHDRHIGERLRAERIRHARSLLESGTEGLLSGLAPTLRWRHPVLEIESYPEKRDVLLGGRGILLIPSYFCWHSPITLADPELPPVIIYPLQHEARPGPEREGRPLRALLGRTRAEILLATTTGATTTEAALRAGVSVGTASHHTAALRDGGLINSDRHANTVLHTLTSLGAALLDGPRTGAGTASR